MDTTAPTAPTTEQAQADLLDRARGFSHRYPVTAEGWVTYQRVPHPHGTVLVQKRDGCTRSVLLPRRR